MKFTCHEIISDTLFLKYSKGSGNSVMQLEDNENILNPRDGKCTE